MRILIVFLAAFIVAACLPAPSAVGQGLGSACSARVVSRQTLRDEAGIEMYVEPTAFSASNGITLLAGTPNYIYAAGQPGTPNTVVRDSVFGMVIGGSGSARTVSSPVAGLPMSLRVLPRKEGGWHVVFAEMPAGYKFPEKEQVVALWYGVLEGTRWSKLEKLPLPAAESLISFNASALLSYGDAIAWALTYESVAGDGVALFERRSGNWDLELIPVPNIAFVSLAHSPRDGLLLLPVRGGVAPERSNALYVYARKPIWRALREIVSGGMEPVFDVQVTSVRSGNALTWWSLVQTNTEVRREARAAPGALENERAEVVLLDADVSRVLAVTTESGAPLWVISAAKPQSNELELRFLTLDARGARHVVRMDDPFDGPFSVFESAPSTLLLAGPLLRRNGDAPALVTSLLRIAIDCAAP